MFFAGFQKIAVAYKTIMKPTSKSPVGYSPVVRKSTVHLKNMAPSKPLRVSSVKPGNPVQGLRGLTGAPESRPWSKIVERKSLQRIRR